MSWQRSADPTAARKTTAPTATLRFQIDGDHDDSLLRGFFANAAQSSSPPRNRGASGCWGLAEAAPAMGMTGRG